MTCNFTALNKLFPALSSPASTSKGERKFEPTEECVVPSEKKKRKTTNIRVKPRLFPIVVFFAKECFKRLC